MRHFYESPFLQHTLFSWFFFLYSDDSCIFQCYKASTHTHTQTKVTGERHSSQIIHSSTGLRTLQCSGRRKSSVWGFADGAGRAAELPGHPVFGCAWYRGRDLVTGVDGHHGNTEVSARAAAEGTWEMRTYYTQSQASANTTLISW